MGYILLNLESILIDIGKKLSEISTGKLCILQVDTMTVTSISGGLWMEMELKWDSTSDKGMFPSWYTEHIQNIATISARKYEISLIETIPT